MPAAEPRSAHYSPNWAVAREPYVTFGGVSEEIGRQLAHPDGLRGRAIGWLMTHANRGPTDRTVAAMAIEAHEIVLDLGCGPGTAVERLARRAGHVHGLDRSETMIMAARRRNRRAVDAGRVELAVGTFEALPYHDRSIDAVLAANVMYFWEDIPTVLREVARVVRPGGRLAIYITLAKTMAKWRFAGAETHRHFCERDVLESLRNAGISETRLTITEVGFSGGIEGLIVVARC